MKLFNVIDKPELVLNLKLNLLKMFLIKKYQKQKEVKILKVKIHHL